MTGGASDPSDTECQQLNDAQADHKHRERYIIVIEQIPIVYTLVFPYVAQVSSAR